MGCDLFDRGVGKGKRMGQIEGKAAERSCVGSAMGSKARKERKSKWGDVNEFQETDADKGRQ